MAALVKFLTSWGALLLGAIGTFLGLRAELRARKEFRWKEEDRKREEAQRLEDDARLKWCEEQRDKLVGEKHGPGRNQLGIPLTVPLEKMQWATWGEQQRYFKAVPHPLGTEVVLVPWTGR